MWQTGQSLAAAVFTLPAMLHYNVTDAKLLFTPVSLRCAAAVRPPPPHHDHSSPFPQSTNQTLAARVVHGSVRAAPLAHVTLRAHPQHTTTHTSPHQPTPLSVSIDVAALCGTAVVRWCVTAAAQAAIDMLFAAGPSGSFLFFFFFFFFSLCLLCFDDCFENNL